ncbi:MAG: hypothetical protein KatS3mg105_2329 [Gemmatales bacterium]|nr:MAG: hypothetical protein KatS3mg105_2329 [Gemmatales bacterium]
MIHFHCKWCGKRYRTEEKNAGRNNLCKRCGRPVWVPIPELRFACPRCGKRYRTEAQHAGLTLPCRDCGEPVTAPRRPDLSPEVLRRLPKGSELPKFFAIEAESQPPPAIDASPFELAPDPNLPPLAEVMVDFPDLSILQEAGLDLPLAQPAPAPAGAASS